jgi:membrane-associated phospholipid phosphatase
MCAFSRLLTQAHFLSDVVGGAIVGGASAWIVWVLYRVLCENRTPVSLRIMRALTRRSSVPLAK